MTYNQMASWINTNYSSDQFNDWEDFTQQSLEDFGTEPDIYEKELFKKNDVWRVLKFKVTKTQQRQIDRLMKEDIIKREQTIGTLEIAKKPLSIKAFVELTGMNPNTARRELGQAVKKGILKRVGRGLYEEL